MASSLLSSARKALKAHLTNTTDDPTPSHGVVRINPLTGDIGLIYHCGSAQRTVKAVILRRTNFGDPGKATYGRIERFTLGNPSANVYGASNDSCENPWINPIEDGFACFWARKNNAITATTMSVGARVECCKLKNDGPSYRAYVPTSGKGYILDDQIIHGELGVMPRSCWAGRNDSVIVYGHQVSYTNVAGAVDRESNLRGAYLNFDAEGKPSFVDVDGNPANWTGGGTGDDAIGAAGATPYLVTGLDNDDNTAAPNNWYSGGGGYLLPYVTVDARGDVIVAVEVFDDTLGANARGWIWTYLFSGPRKPSPGTLLDSSVGTVFQADADLDPLRRPSVACAYSWEYPHNAETGYIRTYLAYSQQESDTIQNESRSYFKTLDYPINGSLTEVVGTIAVPLNTNLDGTRDQQSFGTVVASPFLNCMICENKGLSVGIGGTAHFMLVHDDGLASVERWRTDQGNYPHRPSLDAVQTRDGLKIAALSCEISDDGTEDTILVEVFQF